MWTAPTSLLITAQDSARTGIPETGPRNGTCLRFEVLANDTAAILRGVIDKAYPQDRWIKPIVVMPVCHSLTPFARASFVEAGLRAGAADVTLVDRMICAAIGCGMPITEPSGNMVIDIGSDLEIAVISLASVEYSSVLFSAGAAVDTAIADYIQNAYNIQIGERTAEQIREEIGSAGPLDERISMEIKGRQLRDGTPKLITVSDSEIREAIARPVQDICEAVRVALEQIPPGLAADIVDRGIMLTGPMSILKNLDWRLREETGLPLAIAEDPLSAVVAGAGSLLRHRTVEWASIR